MSAPASASASAPGVLRLPLEQQVVTPSMNIKPDDPSDTGSCADCDTGSHESNTYCYNCGTKDVLMCHDCMIGHYHTDHIDGLLPAAEVTATVSTNEKTGLETLCLPAEQQDILPSMNIEVIDIEYNGRCFDCQAGSIRTNTFCAMCDEKAVVQCNGCMLEHYQNYHREELVAPTTTKTPCSTPVADDGEPAAKRKLSAAFGVEAGQPASKKAKTEDVTDIVVLVVTHSSRFILTRYIEVSQLPAGGLDLLREKVAGKTEDWCGEYASLLDDCTGLSDNAEQEAGFTPTSNQRIVFFAVLSTDSI